MIDEEVRKLVDEAYIKTKHLLIEKKGDVEKLANALLEREVLFQSDVEILIGKRPFEEKKSLAVDEEAVSPLAEQSILNQPKNEEQTDGKADGFDLVPAV
jgi:cell division protease FtsH